MNNQISNESNWPSELRGLIAQTADRIGVPPWGDPLDGTALLLDGMFSSVYVRLPADGRFPLVVTGAPDGDTLRKEEREPDLARSLLSRSVPVAGETPLDPAWRLVPPLHPDHLSLRFPGRVTELATGAVEVAFGDKQIRLKLPLRDGQLQAIVDDEHEWRWRSAWSLALRLVHEEARRYVAAARSLGSPAREVLDALDDELDAMHASLDSIAPSAGFADLRRTFAPDAEPLPEDAGAERLHVETWLALAAWWARRGREMAEDPAVLADIPGLEWRDGRWWHTTECGVLECWQDRDLVLVHGVLAATRGRLVAGWTKLNASQFGALRRTLDALSQQSRWQDWHRLRAHVTSVLSGEVPDALALLEARTRGDGRNPRVDLDAEFMRDGLLEYVERLCRPGVDVVAAARADLEEIGGVEPKRDSGHLVALAGTGSPLVEVHVVLPSGSRDGVRFTDHLVSGPDAAALVGGAIAVEAMWDHVLNDRRGRLAVVLATDVTALAAPRHPDAIAVIRLAPKAFGLTHHPEADAAVAATLRELVDAEGWHEPEQVDDDLFSGVGAARSFYLGIGAHSADTVIPAAALPSMRVLRLLHERLNASGPRPSAAQPAD